MLVITRKIGQQIVLPGCGVTIDVVRVTKGQVRLGIDAPSDVPIHRSEVLDRIRREGELENRATALADVAESPSTAEVSPPDLDRCLAKWIVHRTNGRIGRLCVKTVGDHTLIRGRATSY